MTEESLVQKLPMKHGKAAVVDPALPWYFDNAGRLTQEAARAVGMTVLYPAVQRKFSAEVLEFVTISSKPTSSKIIQRTVDYAYFGSNILSAVVARFGPAGGSSPGAVGNDDG